MIRLQKILVPVDFSRHSEIARDYGCNFADKFGAELHLLTVVQEMIGDMDAFYAVPGNFAQEVRVESERRLATFLDPKWSNGKNISRHAVSGVPFLEIVRYARENAIDLIVMGTHGRGAVKHILMGSVAERVVRSAPCPVLTVRHPEHEFVMP